MTASRDPDRLIHAFLNEGLDELPDPVYDEVRAQIEQTRQRAVIGPWRAPDMNRYLKIGLAAAAVVLIAAVGYQFLGRSNSGGPGATETPQATATPEPSSSAAAELPLGSSHVLWDEGGLKIVVTIPAAGWFGNAGGGVLKKNDSAGAPDGAEVSVFAMTSYGIVGTGDVYVYGDPCHWFSPPPGNRVWTVDKAIFALSAQPSRDASAPADVTYDGYAGKRITLHVPDDAVFADCDAGEFRTLVSWASQGGGWSVARVEDPGQFDLFTVLDVDGQVAFFDLAYFEGAEGTPESVLDEMAAIMESAIFQSYDP